MATNSGTPKVRAGLLACNDPLRKDWTFFRDLFILPTPPTNETPLAGKIREAEEARMRPLLEPPADVTEARDRLRLLLQEAHARHPYRLVNMAYLGGTKGNCSGKIRAFVAALKTKGIDLETTIFNSADTSDRGSALGIVDPAWRTAINYIIQRLWMLNDGEPTVSKLEKYRRLGTSTNEPIRSWLPEDGGVVGYLRERLDHILYDFYDRQKKQDRIVGVSLDAYRDQYALEPDTSGKFVSAHGMAIGAGTPGAGSVPEADRERSDLIEASPQAEAANINDEELLAKQARRDLLDTNITELKSDSTTRGDWPLRLWQFRYNPKSGETVDVRVVRKMTEALLSSIRKVDPDLDADFEAILSALNDWDGTTQICDYLVELPVYAEKHRYALAGIDALPLAKAGPPTRAESKLVQQMDWLGGTAEVLLGTGSDERMAGDSLQQSRVAEETVMFGELLHPDDDVDLRSVERSDYAFLCQHVREPQEIELSSSELHAELRRLRDEWVKGFDQHSTRAKANARSLTELGLRLKKWEPATEHLGSFVANALHEMIVQDIPAPPLAEPSASRIQAELPME